MKWIRLTIFLPGMFVMCLPTFFDARSLWGIPPRLQRLRSKEKTSSKDAKCSAINESVTFFCNANDAQSSYVLNEAMYVAVESQRLQNCVVTVWDLQAQRVLRLLWRGKDSFVDMRESIGNGRQHRSCFNNLEAKQYLRKRQMEEWRFVYTVI